MNNFQVIKRIPDHFGHWDIWSHGMRVYRIRGEVGNVKLWGENIFRNKPERVFTTVESCMAEIIAEFMREDK